MALRGRTFLLVGSTPLIDELLRGYSWGHGLAYLVGSG
jgi:hypothetical protein